MPVGLVLEGGGMRGMYTAGVLDAFLDNEIAADGAVGVSAGALFGVNFLSRQRGRVIRYNKRFSGDKNYIGIRPLLREGNIVNTRFAYEELPQTLDPFDDERFQASGVPFFAVISNIITGRPEYVQIHSVFAQRDTLRASGSLPFVSRPVKIGNAKYLDGGIADSIPFQWMADQGYDKLIVVLTRDITYRKKPASRYADLYKPRYPQFAELLKTRHTRYNASLDLLRQWEEAGKVFVIRPSRPIEIDLMERNPEKLQQIYDLGIRDAAVRMTRLKAYLTK